MIPYVPKVRWGGAREVPPPYNPRARWDGVNGTHLRGEAPSAPSGLLATGLWSSSLGLGTGKDRAAFTYGAPRRRLAYALS